MAILEVKGLCRRFGGLKAVDDVGFDLQEGSIKAVIGPNGAGKTTLFNLLSGAIPSHSGSAVFMGSEIQRLRPHQIAVRGVARTYQHIRLFHGMSALENVMVGCHRLTSAGFLAGMLRLPWTKAEEREIGERAMGALEFVGVAELAQADATSLAFGQQRAVELARAIASEPRLLLLDEPAAGLNMRETAEISGLISRIRDTGMTVLLVEHDMSLVMKISDEVMVLSYGKKIAEDVPLAIQKHPEVISVYLGEGEDA